MVKLDIHFIYWNGIPFYVVVYGFYVHHFSVSKIFLKITMPYILKPIYNYVKWDPIPINEMYI